MNFHILSHIVNVDIFGSELTRSKILVFSPKKYTLYFQGTMFSLASEGDDGVRFLHLFIR